jgi:hypothetical protein
MVAPLRGRSDTGLPADQAISALISYASICSICRAAARMPERSSKTIASAAIATSTFDALSRNLDSDRDIGDGIGRAAELALRDL